MPSHLFTPIKLGGLTLKNRVIISPLCQFSAVDGTAAPWHWAHIGQFAQSGAGLCIFEATAVSAVGRITPGCLGLYSDENEAALTKLLADVRTFSDMPMGIQLDHAGRMQCVDLAGRQPGHVAQDLRLCRTAHDIDQPHPIFEADLVEHLTEI